MLDDDVLAQVLVADPVDERVRALGPHLPERRGGGDVELVVRRLAFLRLEPLLLEALRDPLDDRLLVLWPRLLELRVQLIDHRDRSPVLLPGLRGVALSLSRSVRPPVACRASPPDPARVRTRGRRLRRGERAQSGHGCTCSTIVGAVNLEAGPSQSPARRAGGRVRGSKAVSSRPSSAAAIPPPSPGSRRPRRRDRKPT